MGTATKEKEQKKDTLDLIEEDMGALDHILFEVEGVLPDDEAASIVDGFFAELAERRDAKLNGYVWAIKRALATAEQKKAQANVWLAQAKRLGERVDYLKSRLLAFVQVHGEIPNRKETHEIDTGLYRICEQRNGGKEPITYLVEPLDLPAELRTDVLVVKVFAQQDDVLKAILEAAKPFGGAVTVNRTAAPVEESVRGALLAGEEARALRQSVEELTESEREPSEEEEIFKYARLEPRGVHLRFY